MRTNGKMEENRQGRSRRGSAIVPFALGAVIGGVVGAAVALLYAPVEGAELRRGVSDKLDDIVDGAKDILKNAKSSAEKMFSEGMSRDEEDDAQSSQTRGRADDIIENADRAIADARRRSRRHDDDEDEA